MKANHNEELANIHVTLISNKIIKIHPETENNIEIKMTATEISTNLLIIIYKKSIKQYTDKMKKKQDIKDTVSGNSQNECQ